MNITAHWQHNGEWIPFEQPLSFLHQSTANVCAMFEGGKNPVVMKIEGGFICTSNMKTEIRKEHPPEVQVISFKQIKPDNRPFYKVLGIETCISH